ncbi:4-hydroxy-tetrahydrodipicolinate synthase [Paenochrobactrum gallinarii]|uniref:4-hydroxy-tetrahydrodipicolinate synthase n=1 Tax=Paenochrobactrum gallinarii TaxID=643673 RepID=A0A841M614_9HYPH|nr:dihydrodipicolinate synthase family protein [Paenochrobactrum gallinarii]MBB6261014.1 4-hydroxy-tetrahydrodipicolinate synthase [Paenochrobactrum gallinarii]
MSLFQGVMPYLVSPLKENAQVNETVLAKLCEDLIAKDVHGLTPLGSTGEYAYLNDAQKQRVIEVVVEAANGRVPVIAGVASTSTEGAIAQAKLYKKIGVSGIVSVLDSYFPLTEAEIQNYFLTIANQAGLPMIVYTNPNFQRTDLTVDTISILSKHSNIIGLKDASSNTGRLLTIMERCGDNLDVYAASSHIAVSVLMMGGKGIFAGPACVLPEKSVALYQACMADDWKKAAILQKQLWQFNDVFARYRLAGCIKTALHIQGYDVGNPVLPQAPLDETARATIAEALRKSMAD